MPEWIRDVARGVVIALAVILIVLFTANAIEGFVYGAF